MSESTQTVDQHSFVEYILKQIAQAGAKVSKLAAAPHAEEVAARHRDSGWSFGITVQQSGRSAQVGLWYRPAPLGRLSDLNSLLSYYREQLEPRGHAVYITTPVTELGIFAVLWTSENTVTGAEQDAWSSWAESISEQCFGHLAFSQYLEFYRQPAKQSEAPAEQVEKQR